MWRDGRTSATAILPHSRTPPLSRVHTGDKMSPDDELSTAAHGDNISPVAGEKLLPVWTSL